MAAAEHELESAGRRRLWDRRPTLQIQAGDYSTRLELPRRVLCAPDDVDYGPQFTAITSRGRSINVTSAAMPLGLRRSWAGASFRTMIVLFTVAAVVAGPNNPQLLWPLLGWLFGVGIPAVLICSTQSLFRAWWSRSGTRDWLDNELDYQWSPNPDKSQAAYLWQQAMRAVIQVQQVTGLAAAEQLEPHLQRLYPHVVRMQSLREVGADNLNLMDGQRTKYEQAEAEAKKVIGDLLADADLALTQESNTPVEWRPDGVQLPEPQLICEDDLR